mgnify:CR=1 FL=1
MMWMAVQQMSHNSTHSHNNEEDQRPDDQIELRIKYNKEKDREKKFQEGRPYCYYDT